MEIQFIGQRPKKTYFYILGNTLVDVKWPLPAVYGFFFVNGMLFIGFQSCMPLDC